MKTWKILSLIAGVVFVATIALREDRQDALESIERSKPRVSSMPSDINGKPVIDTGVKWSDLNNSQKTVLAPLKDSWMELSELRRKKWMEIANRYPNMPEGEQARMQARMKEWSELTPQQRKQARENYATVKTLPKDERQQQWEAYQQLSEAEKKELADQAKRTKTVQTDTSRPAGAASVTRPTNKQLGSDSRSGVIPPNTTSVSSETTSN